MLSPEQGAQSIASNKNAIPEELPVSPKAAEVCLGRRKYREKMIKYLDFCFPGIDTVELQNTLKECMFQVDKAVNILEKASGITATIDFVSWLKIINFNLKEIKNLTRPPNGTAQITNETEWSLFKLETLSPEVPEKISREEQILNIIEENQINVENATLMQLLARPVVCLERLPFSTIESKYQNLKKKLALSSSPHKKINKTVVSNIKTDESVVKNEVNTVSPRKRKLEDKIKRGTKRKKYADINKVNEEINSILDDDILQSLSSEEIFKKGEINLKSCDEIIVFPPAVISQEKTFNNGKNESVCTKRIKIKIKIQHTTGVRTFSLIDDHNREKSESPNKVQITDDISELPPNRMQLSDTNNIHKTKIDEVPDNDTNNKQENSCSIVEKSTNKNSNSRESNLLTTGQETSSAINLNRTQKIGKISTLTDSICGEGNTSLITNQGISHLTDSINVNDNSCGDRNVTVTVSKKINLNHDQESATVTRKDTRERRFPLQIPVMTTQPKPTPNPNSSRGNYLLNVSVEQAADTLLPLIKCLVSIAESNNPEAYCKTLPIISNSLKYYLSKICIHSFNIRTFINIAASKLSRKHNSLELDKKIVEQMFKVLSMPTDQPAEESEFMLRFYTELENMANDPKYALDPLVSGGSNISAQKLDSFDGSRFYDGHTYRPVDGVLLTNVTQVHKTTQPSVKQNCNSSCTNVKNRQSNCLPVSKSFIAPHLVPLSASKNCSSSQNTHRSAYVSNSTSTGESYPSWDNNKPVANRPAPPNKALDPLVNSNCSSSTFSIPTTNYTTPEVSNQPVVSSTTSISSRPVCSMLTSRNIEPCQKGPIKPSLQPPSPQCHKKNSHLKPNNSKLISQTVPPGSCSVSSGTLPAAYQGTFSVPSVSHSFSNTSSVPSVSKVALECNIQKQLSSNCNIINSNNNIQNRGTFLAPCIPHSTSHTVSWCNTQKESVSGLNTTTINNSSVQNGGTFPVQPGPHSSSNASHLSMASNAVSKCNIQKESTSGLDTTTINNNSVQKGGTFPVPSVPHSSSNASHLSMASNTVSRCNIQKESASGYYMTTFHNSSVQKARTFPVPVVPHSSKNASHLSMASNTVSRCNIQKESASGYNMTTFHNSSVQKAGTFPVPVVPHSSKNASHLSCASNTVSRCNIQNIGYNATTFNNCGVQKGGTFPVPSVPHSSSNTFHLSSASNTVSKGNSQNKPVSGCSTTTFNNSSVKNGVPSVPHSSSNALHLSSATNIASRSNSQKETVSGYSTTTSSVQNRGAFPVPSVPHSSSNAVYLSSPSNTVSNCNILTMEQYPTRYRIPINNNIVQRTGAFPASIPHSASSVSNTASCYNTQNKLLSGYNTVTFSNNVHSERVDPTAPILNSTSNTLLLYTLTNGVSKSNSHSQLQQPPLSNSVSFNNDNIHNKIHLNNNITSVSSQLNKEPNKNAVLSSNKRNAFPTGVYPNNETQSFITNVSPLVPKLVPKQVPAASSQERTALNSGNKLSLIQTGTVTDNEGHITSHQSFQQVVPQNYVSFNSIRGERTEKEDDSMASLKSYEVNMNSMLPNMNGNCHDIREFVDLDYYYSNLNNK